MATQMRNGLWLEDGCLCAGTGCGGHLRITPPGYQGAAQHTWTQACDGFHAPGPCLTRREVLIPAGATADGTWCPVLPVRFPAGTGNLHGAVVALHVQAYEDTDPVVTAEVRIPGPPVP